MKLINSQKLSLVILTLACTSMTRASDLKTKAPKRPAPARPISAEDIAERDRKIAELRAEKSALLAEIDTRQNEQLDSWSDQAQLYNQTVLNERANRDKCNRLRQAIEQAKHYDIAEGDLLPGRVINKKPAKQKNADLWQQVWAEEERANKEEKRCNEYLAALVEEKRAIEELSKLKDSYKAANEEALQKLASENERQEEAAKKAKFSYKARRAFNRFKTNKN